MQRWIWGLAGAADLFGAVALPDQPASAAQVILNEYNGVSDSIFLNGGTAGADLDGGHSDRSGA